MLLASGWLNPQILYDLAFLMIMFSMCSVVPCFYRHLNIPVLPNGLHIMADQGFPRTAVFLVAPKRNAPNQLPAHIRRSKYNVVNTSVGYS